MTTPTTSELLIQEVRKNERLEILRLAEQCKTIEEFRQRLTDLLNKQ